MTAVDPSVIELVLWVASSLVLVVLVYVLALVALSRYEPGDSTHDPLPPVRARAKSVVVVLPCLNEERRLGDTLGQLVAMDQPRMSILVVDDASSDGTADLVRTLRDPRVHLLQRTSPQARQGRGPALNAALAHLRRGAVPTLPDPSDVVVCVLNPGERWEGDTLAAVLPMFDDPRVGVVELASRVDDRERKILARVQDLEELLRAEVIQRGRQHFGSESLGCAGQFVRLSALRSLGATPWSRGLAPEVDLGVRLLLDGWRTRFTCASAVHRPGPAGIGDWLGQRTRRAQGQIQCWPLVPEVMQHLGGMTRVHLLHRLSSPVPLLFSSLVATALVLWAGALTVGVAAGSVTPSWWWASPYLVALVPAVFLAEVYREASGDARGVGARWRTVLVMHLYAGYAVLWSAAGWWALVRVLTRRRGRRGSNRSRYAARHRQSRRGAWAWLVAPVCAVGVGLWILFGSVEVSVQSGAEPAPSRVQPAWPDTL